MRIATAGKQRIIGLSGCVKTVKLTLPKRPVGLTGCYCYRLRRVPRYLGTQVLGGAREKEGGEKRKAGASGGFHGTVQLPLRRYQLPRKAFYLTASKPLLVGKGFFCKFLPDLIKPKVPCTAELFADHSVLVDLVLERSGLEGSLRLR